MTAQAITGLVARFASCLSRRDVGGAAACVATPSAVFYGDRVNALQSAADVTDLIQAYLDGLSQNGLDRVEMSIKAQSMTAGDQCSVWVATNFSDAVGAKSAQSVSRFFCKPDADGDYKIMMFEVLEHDDALLPAADVWAGLSRQMTKGTPEIAERRGRKRDHADDARSRAEFAGFSAIDDPQLRENWGQLVTDALTQKPDAPNQLFADQMRVYVEDQSVTLQSAVGLYGYFGGFQARLALAGATGSCVMFDKLATNQNQDVLLHGRWIWDDAGEQRYHLADVSYIFENKGTRHEMSVVAMTNIDPAIRPSLNGTPATPLTQNTAPRRYVPASEHI